MTFPYLYLIYFSSISIFNFSFPLLSVIVKIFSVALTNKRADLQNCSLSRNFSQIDLYFSGFWQPFGLHLDFCPLFPTFYWWELYSDQFSDGISDGICLHKQLKAPLRLLLIRYFVSSSQNSIQSFGGKKFHISYHIETWDQALRSP